MTRLRLDLPVTRFRTAPARGHAPGAIDPAGGRWGAGLIRDVSVATAGEALGHGIWLDREFLAQVVTAVNQTGQRGVKSRFTHPDISGDGLGKYLGRLERAVTTDDRIVADLHFAPSAHQTPDGDLAAYLMQRAQEDPESFGLSIVFDRDPEAENAHLAQHGADHFASPDPANVQNLPHARLADLHACDVVDDPAANPDGLFQAGPLAGFERLAEYALGLSETWPAATALDVHPDRLRDFVGRFLTRRQLRITRMDQRPETLDTAPDDTTAPPPIPSPADVRAGVAYADQTGTLDLPAPEDVRSGVTYDNNTQTGSYAPTAADPPAPDPADLHRSPADPARAAGLTTPAAPLHQPADTAAPAQNALDTLRLYLETFGDVGARYLADGLTYEAALERELEATRHTLRETREQLAAAEAQLAAVNARRARHDTRPREEPDPLQHTPEPPRTKRTMREAIRIRK